MTRKLTEREQRMLRAHDSKPQSWRSEWKKRENNAPKGRELSFTDIVTLRRVQAGESSAEICAAFRIARSTLNMRVAAILKRFEVETRQELLALPEIQEQLRED